MYDKLIQNYRVHFEGSPEPIFYKSFYPIGIDDEDLDHWASLPAWAVRSPSAGPADPGLR